jgi:hypothetical protein
MTLSRKSRITETVAELYCKDLSSQCQNLTRTQKAAATKHSKINLINNSVQIRYHSMSVAGKHSLCH